MTKFKNLFLILLASLLAFSSCEKNTIDIPLSSATIVLDDILVVDASKSTMNSFSVTQTIDYESIAGLSDEVDKYRSHIQSIEADTVYITITTTDGEGTVIENFLIKVNGLNDFSIPQYDLGTVYTASHIPAYVTQLMFKIMNGNSLELNISGETDVASGEYLQVEITLKNVVIKAKVVDFL